MAKSKGRKNMTRSKKNCKGGFLGSVINQAIVPLSILGLQQSYRRRKHGGTRKKRSRR